MWSPVQYFVIRHRIDPVSVMLTPDAGTLCIKPRVGIFFIDFSCGIPVVRPRVLVLYLLLGVVCVCVSQVMPIWFVRARV